MLFRCILLPPLLLFAFFVKAQHSTYHFSRVDIESGLSNNQVNAIYRDSVGFAWFGTTDGLNRFDGFTCKVFTNIPNDSTSVEDNFILDIFSLPDHKLWINSKNAIAIYNAATETFDRNYRAYLKKWSLPVSRPVTILNDKRGGYWFLFEKEGLYNYSVRTQKTLRYNKKEQPYSGSTITQISQDAHGNIWVIYANGLLEQLDATLITPVRQLPALSYINTKGRLNYKFVVDRQNSFWVWVEGETYGVFKIDPQHAGITHFHTGNAQFRLNSNLVRGIVQDTKGAIWIGTDHGGVNLVNEQNNSNITYLQSKEADNGSLSYNSVESIYEDGKGIIWVGTGKKGVSYLNENITQFELYKHEVGNSKSLPYNDIIYFVEDKRGNLWIGTDGGGLLYFDRSKNTFTQYLNNPNNPNSLSNNVVVSLCLDHENKLWIGTYLGGMDCFDGSTFTHYRNNPADPNSISNDGVWHILEDNAHTLWIGTLKGGLDRFDRKTKTFTHYYLKNNSPYPIHSNYIPVIREDRQHALWIGTDVGMEMLNRQRNRFSYYTHTAEAGSLSHPLVTDILEDSRGLLWTGTRAGLNVLNRKTKQFKRFYTTDGLPSDIISNIAEDKNGNLWITTSKGLCELIINVKGDNVSFSVRHFSETNNLQGKAFNESACVVTKAGEIVVGGSAGFNIIDPGKITVVNTKPDVVFTSIDIFNNEADAGKSISQNTILRKAMPSVQELKLNYNENIFSLEFIALDFSHTNRYAYKLEGFNNAWMYANSESRKVTYTNLDPGTYYFKVKATNGNGIWAGEEKTLKIVIKTPYWKRPLAFLLYALALTGILLLARRYLLEKAHMRFEVAQQKKEAERIQALDAIKTKFFTNVSHEFRTPLSLIVTPLDRLLKNSTDTEQKRQIQLVQRNAKRLLNLVNQLLDFRKMDVQEFQLQVTEGDMIQFIKEATCSFSDLSEMKRIALAFTANVESFVTHFDKDKLEKIMFNLLSNAFKYTPRNGSVAVAVWYKAKTEMQEEAIEISVADTGIGIPADKQEQIFERFFQNDVPANITNPGTGIGLAITKEFVKLHKGAIRVTSEPESGTTFAVTLPVRKSGNAFIQNKEIQEFITPLSMEEGAEKTATATSRKALPTVLLAEDNDDFRFYLKDNLNPHYQVVETENGQQAWETLANLKPDLIISDVMMPYMDGIELTKRIKTHPALSGTPIILLTAVGDEELQLESYRLGVSDYMQKPFTFEILASRVKNLIAEKQQAYQKPSKFVEMAPSEVEITPADTIFLQQVLAVIEKNMGNPEFTVEELSKEMFMHRAGMYRKLLSLTGKTPIEFIRQIRLKRGAQLLERSGMNIAEVAYEVGFNNPKKFTQYFKEEFGATPSDFQRNLGTR